MIAVQNIFLYLSTKSVDYKIKNEILVSDHAHHSDLVPLQEYAKRNGLKIILAGENILDLITEKTLIVSCMYASNVTGEIFDVQKISEHAKIVKYVNRFESVQPVGVTSQAVLETGKMACPKIEADISNEKSNTFVFHSSRIKNIQI